MVFEKNSPGYLLLVRQQKSLNSGNETPINKCGNVSSKPVKDHTQIVPGNNFDDNHPMPHKQSLGNQKIRTKMPRQKTAKSVKKRQHLAIAIHKLCLGTIF